MFVMLAPLLGSMLAPGFIMLASFFEPRFCHRFVIDFGMFVDPIYRCVDTFPFAHPTCTTFKSINCLTSLHVFTLQEDMILMIFIIFLDNCSSIDSLRSALARPPACTLQTKSFLRMLAPCLASALSRYHPGLDPTPLNPDPQGTHPTPPQPQ